MAYVGSLKVTPGETVQDAINTYLDLKLRGLTYSDTVVDFNDNQYPIGYFDEETIDLFKLGVVTVTNLHGILGHGGKTNSEEYKKHANFFADKVVSELKDNPYKVNSILDGFDEVMYNSSESYMFDSADRERIAEQLAQLDAGITK